MSVQAKESEVQPQRPKFGVKQLLIMMNKYRFATFHFTICVLLNE